MSNHDNSFGDAPLDYNLNTFSSEEVQEMLRGMEASDSTHNNPSSPIHLSNVPDGGAELPSSGFDFGFGEPLDFGMPSACQSGLLESDLPTSANGQGPSDPINQNNETDETLEHLRQNYTLYENNFQDVVNNLPTPQQGESGTIDPSLLAIDEWNKALSYPDAVLQSSQTPSLAASQEQQTTPQDGAAVGANHDQGNGGVNLRFPEVDMRVPAQTMHTTNDTHQLPHDGSTFQAAYVYPSGTTSSNHTAPGMFQRELDPNFTTAQQPVVHPSAYAAVPIAGQAADLGDDVFTPEDIVDTMNEAELREYTRGLIRTNNHRIRTQIYVRRLRDSRSGSINSSPTPAVSGNSNGSKKATGPSPLSGNQLKAGPPCPATGSSAVAGSKRKRSRNSEEEEAAVRRVLQLMRQHKDEDDSDDNKYPDDGTKVDDQVDPAYNPQKKRKKAIPGAVIDMKAAIARKLAKQSGPNGTKERCQLKLTGGHQPPYNPFSGLASGRTTPHQLIRDYPTRIHGGAALAIRHTLALSSGSGRCEAHEVAPMFDRQHNVTEVYVRQIFSKAKAGQADHIKNNPDLRPRCGNCTDFYRECSLRRNENSSVPCEECREEGLEAYCMVRSQPNPSYAPPASEG